LHRDKASANILPTLVLATLALHRGCARPLTEPDMIAFRDRMARGRSRTGWLDSRHSFSFADYHDPTQMGFRALRVINEDRVIPGAGFPSHRHRDMDILTTCCRARSSTRTALATAPSFGPARCSA